MDVTSQVLHDVEFREAKRGGYNTHDVDEFLERLAVAIDRQEALVRDARQRVAQAEARATEAERRAEGHVGGASDADETLKRTLVLAQRTADAAIREAEERAARMVAAAEDEAARLLSEAQESATHAYAEAEDGARRAQQEARNRVLAELHDLEAARDQLRSDVDLLEHHIEEQRDRLRLTVREMQALIDDPAALREVAVPFVADIVVPAQPEPPAARPQLVAEPVEEAEAWPEPEEAWPEATEEDFGPLRTLPTSADQAPATSRPLLADPDGFASEEEDAYLAELRKAMTDDRPLGPRDDPEGSHQDDEREGGRSRFGRRR